MERAKKEERGFARKPHLLDLIGTGGMPEEEADELAYRLVRRARGEIGAQPPEAEAPSPEEVRRRREARRRRESGS